jgi:predicted short-subunit dehydrogenase-like oxidoreductase (DUF2520 family)
MPQQHPPSLNLIGAGRVGRTLARLWQQHGVLRVQDVLTTSPASAHDAVAFIGAGQPVARLQAMRAADVWLLAVPDRQIAPMAQALAELHHSPALAFHASGALPAEELQSLQALGWRIASAHPLLSFASAQAALAQFAGTPCALQGDAAAVQALRPWLSAIGGVCFELQAADKLRYHAGAVFATNFLPVLQAVAERLWRDSGMPAEQVQALRARLLPLAVANLLSLGPQGALTGPAARGDWPLVQQQEQALLHWDTDAAQAYAALSRLAARLDRGDL